MSLFFRAAKHFISLPSLDHTSVVQECARATFFVSLWKREKCANRFRAIRKRERSAGWKRGIDGEFSRAVFASHKLHLRDSYSLHVISYVRACHESTRQLQVTCIVISKSSPGEPVFLRRAAVTLE